jgi:hypothetical protein
LDRSTWGDFLQIADDYSFTRRHALGDSDAIAKVAPIETIRCSAFPLSAT